MAGFKRVPIRVTDCFLVANEAFMRRTGQGEHVSQSILDLDRLPDVASLQSAAAKLTQRYPILGGKLKRDWLTWLPYWKVPPAEKMPPLPVGLWVETGAKIIAGATFFEITNSEKHLQQILHKRLANGERFPFSARLDVLLRRDDSCLLALTWAHRLIDGKGAELLLAEIARLCAGDDSMWQGKEMERPVTTFKEKIAKTKAAILRFDEFARLGVHSLGGPRPWKGQCCYHVITLNEVQTARVNQRASDMTGPLFPLPWFLACVVRAHWTVFKIRGNEPACLVASVPMQLRKRGAHGPLFHNQITMLFFCSMREHADSLVDTALDLKNQFAEMTRKGLAESFTTVLELMMRAPSGLFMRIVRWQFKGEVNSFYHSHTGPFAPDLVAFGGAKIRNAWHLPCLGSPPGTGIFFNERNGKLNVVLSWREGCVTDEERSAMLASLMNDLLGGNNDGR